MNSTETELVDGLAPQAKSAYSRQIDAVGWGLLLIWIGVAVLADLGWGWSLIGMSGIVLGAQVALWQQGDKVDGFAVACGVVFFLGGAWVALGLTWPLAPVLLILLGAALLWKTMLAGRAR